MNRGDFEYYHYFKNYYNDRVHNRWSFGCTKLLHGESDSICEISHDNQPAFFAQVASSHRGCYHFPVNASCHQRRTTFLNNGRKAKVRFCYEVRQYCEFQECHGKDKDHNSFIACFLTNGTAVSFTSQLNRWQGPDQLPCTVRWLDQVEIDGISVYVLEVTHGLFLVKALCDIIQVYTQPYIE